jgi:hypothetical protein
MHNTMSQFIAEPYTMNIGEAICCLLIDVVQCGGDVLAECDPFVEKVSGALMLAKKIANDLVTTSYTNNSVFGVDDFKTVESIGLFFDNLTELVHLVKYDDMINKFNPPLSKSEYGMIKAVIAFRIALIDLIESLNGLVSFIQSKECGLEPLQNGSNLVDIVSQLRSVKLIEFPS